MAYFSSISFVFYILAWCFQRTINKGSTVSFLMIANLSVHHISFMFVFPVIMLCIFQH